METNLKNSCHTQTSYWGQYFCVATKCNLKGERSQSELSMGSATFFKIFHSFSIKTQRGSEAKTSRRLQATSSEDFVLKAGGTV